MLIDFFQDFSFNFTIFQGREIFMSWLFKPKRLVTLDVGSHTLKLGDFSFKKAKPFLQNFAVLPVPDNCIEQGDLVDLEPFENILPDFISQNVEGSVPELYVSMSGRSVVVKKIEILRSEEELMDDLVQEEVSQSLPFNLDEINYDYTQMMAPKPPNDNKMNILLVAAKNDIVDKINQLIKKAGYRCKFIDMGAFALSECVKFTDSDFVEKNKNILILDIGKSGTVFIVLHRGQLIFSRYMMIGSDFYTVSLMKEMGIEYQEAESLKVSWCSGDETPPEVKRVIEESDRYFCDEVFIGCEYFKNQFPEEEILQVCVTGGGGKMTNLIEAVSKKFNAPARLLDPFKVLDSSDFLKDSLSHIKCFASSSIGMCLRGMSR